MHNQEGLGEEDGEATKKLAGYMPRAPLLQMTSCDTENGTMIYRSTMHMGPKRHFQLMPGAQWLELLLRHVPDRYDHLVHYVGWYSNRARESRLGAAGPQSL